MSDGGNGIPAPAVRDGQNGRTKRFLHDCSIEVVPRGPDPSGAVRRRLLVGTSVYIACVPGEDYERIIALCAQLRRAGFVPVPHLPARGLPSRSILDERLRRLAGEAGVDRLLLIGGDIPDSRAGPFASALQVLQTGLLSRHGVTGVGFATYPEHHHALATPLLESALRDKLAVAAEGGLRTWLVSQFSFNAATVIRHARHLRAMGIDAPLHVGVSGPASWVAMAKFALICGFANSARSLSQDAGRLGWRLSGFDPTEMLSHLAESAATTPMLGLASPHFFSFGGAERTAGLIASLIARPT